MPSSPSIAEIHVTPLAEDHIVAPCVFTLGYQKRTIDDYLLELQRAGIKVLVDVRETAWSRKPGFSKTALQQRLAAVGIAYVHASFAGNPRAIRRAASSHEECLQGYSDHLNRNDGVLEAFDQLMMQWAKAGAPVCLLCYERHPNDCHRSILLSAWVGSRCPSVQVKHMGQDGAPRLPAL